MTDIFVFVLQLSLVGTALTLAVFFFKPALLKACGGKKYHQICLFVAIMFLTPFHLFRILEIAHVNLGLNAIPGTLTVLHVEEAISSNGQVFSLYTLVSWIWFVAAVLLLVQAVISYAIFYRRLVVYGHEASAEVYGTLFGIMQELKVRRNIRVYLNDSITSPMVIGFRKFLIVLPSKPLSKEERSLVLKHELIHIKRGDYIRKVLMSFVRSVHWFNPAVYLLASCFNESCEYACDEAVVGKMTRNERQYYGEMILSFLHPKSASTAYANALSKNKNTLKRRLALIMNTSVFSRKAVMVAFSLLLIFAAGIVAYTQTSFAQINDAAKDVAANRDDVDDTQYEEDANDVKGTLLEQADSVTLDAIQSGDMTQGTTGKIVTNTTHIHVSAENLTDGKQIRIYLYDAAYPSDSIQVATLTNGQNTVDFSNLTSAKEYILKTGMDGSDGAVRIRVGD